MAVVRTGDPNFAGDFPFDNLRTFAGGVFVDTSGDWHVHGSDDDDTITIDDEDIIITGGLSKSVDISLAPGPVRVRAHAGDDTATIDAAFEDSAYLFGGLGDDDLTGGDENDLLSGGGGEDLLDGGAGNDIYQITAETSDITISDASGIDTLDFSKWYGISGVTVDLAFAEDTWQTIHGWHEVRLMFIDDEIIENILGSLHGDILIGSSVANAISGGDGADSISGGDDDDELDGDEGNDNIDGGEGERRSGRRRRRRLLQKRTTTTNPMPRSWRPAKCFRPTWPEVRLPTARRRPG